MAEINVLDSKTIDQIAAGEVVERPASVVKELVENACDAGATAVTVEIKDGGTTFIRVTDNGSGIPKDQVKKAFFRHATSKIKDASDLTRLSSLGFRGEALSSISAVSMVEIITKTKDALTGIRYCIEGERERDFHEVGAPDGTTIMIRDLFFNTPARKKFLKTPATEGSYIVDLMEHMALCRPDISFQLLVNRQTRFQTSGSGDLKEVVYRIYGRQIAKEMIPFSAYEEGIKIEGYLGTPQLVRPNRNFEFFFVNKRYIRSAVLSKGLESGYADYLMQHKFPMAYLHLDIDTEAVDVNVHPSKMEVRFSDNRKIADFLEKSVREALKQKEMIPEITLDEPVKPAGYAAEKPAVSKAAQNISQTSAQNDKKNAVQNQEKNTIQNAAKNTAQSIAQKIQEQPKPVLTTAEPKKESSTPKPYTYTQFQKPQQKPAIKPQQALPVQPFEKKTFQNTVRENIQSYQADTGISAAESRQMNLFEEKLLTQKAVEQYELIGQVFDTYWIATYQNKMILIDQHAAHEKVKYEALIKQFQEGCVISQNLMPPMIVTLTPLEESMLKQYEEYFAKAGFEIEEFGGNSYAIRSVPCDLYGNLEQTLLQEILEELGGDHRPGTPAAISERIATMACKAAVKGNHKLNREEMQSLLQQLLTLDNPYHCPHGRPTMITMTKQELEKKFKRII